ncbi:hypothetical protein [Ruegeria sediminis]|nr:hypothetical protein [Ruegeria sediminis]
MRGNCAFDCGKVNGSHPPAAGTPQHVFPITPDMLEKLSRATKADFTE